MTDISLLVIQVTALGLTAPKNIDLFIVKFPFLLKKTRTYIIFSFQKFCGGRTNKKLAEIESQLLKTISDE